ncbi:MAG TPA: hypothetical protein O0X19_05605 [Methanocorpusculum sp.]|nr:hypothetical protein [Candidatus Methanocorpusculum equi]MCQ2357200.1 hypothetical protein [Methanocorpusculum sp.]HJJ33830.1 hypothetical protein [Methanocorpusculum sp.]HJJ44375.1 hypothetical protein [Methanocorpusculum sp.]
MDAAEINYDQALSEISIILQTAGYDCENEEGVVFNLSGVRGNKCIIVLCSDDMNVLQRFDMIPYTINLNGSKTRCDKLIFSGNTVFRPKESVLWTKEELLAKISAAAEARIYRLPFDIESVPSFAIPAAAAPSSGFDYDLMLPVRIDAAAAVRVAHQEGPTILRMIPYWRYTYTSGGEASYKGKVVAFDGEGSGWINAVNGLETEFDTEAVPVAGELDKDADIVSPVIMKQEVKETITASLIKKLTKRIRLKITAGDAIFAEEKEFKPTEDNFVLKIEKVYIPVWQVRGNKDIVEVNAFTGEELSLPSDEGCEVF